MILKKHDQHSSLYKGSEILPTKQAQAGWFCLSYLSTNELPYGLIHTEWLESMDQLGTTLSF